MARALPSGTVTFLFTDVEGSTRLLEALGAERYAAALAEHRRLIREACAREGGVEVDTQGDAFFFAFPTAPGALAAAAALTDALAPGPIRVRVGLHTGTPLLVDEGYVGGDVHRAARIAAAGHGGQVLVSSSTAALAAADLLDLGEHRLKDLAAAERVFQLGPDRHPPLKSLYRTNLPVPATPFVGRERELADVVDLLGGDARIVTLTGPGGTGKTRLALQAAAEASDAYPDGLWWVPLAPLRDPGAVLPTIAQSLGATVDLREHIADKRMLLLLDNLEHLLEALPQVAGLLADCPGFDVLATSREVLQLQGEHAYPVPPLTQEDGSRLFVSRVRAAAGEADDDVLVAELVRRLDSLPLALELAAARTRHLTLEQLVERLSRRLDLLRAGRDADPRQQTLRATIEWSEELLDEEERRLFARLSVFAGGCTLAAAEAVCGAGVETLGSLVDKSLVRRAGDRYWMLETIREFATERLEELGETGALHRRLALYLLEVALSSGMAADSDLPQRQLLVIPERDNVRAALMWAHAQGEHELGLRLLVELENFWAIGAADEGARWAAAFLGAAGDDAPRELRARGLRVWGGMLNITGGVERAEELWTESLEICRSLGDERAVAIMLHRLAGPALRRGDVAHARALAEESLAGHRRAGFRKGEAQALSDVGRCLWAEGDRAGALELLDTSAAIAEDVGFLWWQAGVLARRSALLLELGRTEDAASSARGALSISSAMRDTRGIVYELALLAEIAAEQGDLRRAGRLWGAMEAEIERAPVGRWLHGTVEPERVLRHAGPELEAGRGEGRSLPLDEAIRYALDARDPRIASAELPSH